MTKRRSGAKTTDMAFLVFEGLDGSGKSTLIQRLSAHLRSIQKSVTLTHEPGGTPLAEDIRHLILRTEGEAPVPRAELLLYQASRAQHVDTVIKPLLKHEDSWILCDRFTGSTLAFQCGGRGLDRTDVDRLNKYATDGVKPDLWVLLDLSLEESLRRRQSREDSGGKDEDRLEKEKSTFHENVRSYYLQLAKAEAENWLVLNAEQTQDELFENLLSALRERKWLV